MGGAHQWWLPPDVVILHPPLLQRGGRCFCKSWSSWSDDLEAEQPRTYDVRSEHLASHSHSYHTTKSRMFCNIRWNKVSSEFFIMPLCKWLNWERYPSPWIIFKSSLEGDNGQLSSPVLPCQWYKEILIDGAFRQLTFVQVLCWG